MPKSLQEEEWIEALQVEVMEDYIFCIEETFEGHYGDKKIQMRREHFDKLKAFISQEIALAEKRAKEEVVRDMYDELIQHTILKIEDTAKTDYDRGYIFYQNLVLSSLRAYAQANNISLT